MVFDNKGMQVALIKSKYGDWVLPKGHVEKGESLEDAAAREIREELGLDDPLCYIDKIQVVSYSYLGEDGAKHHKEVHYYLFVLKKRCKLEPDKAEGIIAARWFDYDTALKKLHYPADKASLVKSRLLYKPYELYPPRLAVVRRREAGEPYN